MTHEELQAIKARAEAVCEAVANPARSTHHEMAASQADVPALVAEVERLRRIISRACDGADDERIAMEAAIEEERIRDLREGDWDTME